MCRSGLILAGAAILAFSACGTVEMSQEVVLEEGWNAVYVQVSPNMSADVLFATWPVDWVALYDQSAYLETRQYSGTDSTEGTGRSGYRMWRRGDPGASSFTSVPANSVLVCYAKGAWSGKFYGTVRAPRITWHKSSSQDTMNLIGFSTWGETSKDAYFSGNDIGAISYYLVGGGDLSKPSLMPVTGMFLENMTFENGTVLAMDASRMSDWSGVLNVTPTDGLDFGSNSVMRILSVRNDGATNRTVSVRMSAGASENLLDISPVPPGLYVRDMAWGSSNETWSAFTVDSTITKELVAGETLNLQFRINRAEFATTNSYPAAGTEYGAILSIRDEDGGSKMRVNVPIEAVSDGGASEATAWPKGLWIAEAKLDTVTFLSSSSVEPRELPSGGQMKVRLPLYVDGNGATTLLQRFWCGYDTNGVMHVCSGSVKESDTSLTGMWRMSSPFLPTDQPTIDGAEDNAFGRSASFAFTVGEKSGVNPMYHAQHPQHDGLTANYGESAPSGDDFRNYSGTVKPETFSINNRITFAWNSHAGSAWNPEETLSGTLTWEFDGLRHEGTLRAKGAFTMKRISPMSMKVK